jgi:hypothetical protein
MPADTWLADPSTDILKAHRRKSIRNAFIALGVVAVAIAAIVVLLNRGSSTPAPVAAVPVDAGVRRAPPPPDAAEGPSHDDIIALSRYGFLTMAANGKTSVYVDDQLVGLMPLTKLPLQPGVHKVKLVGPKNKTKKLDVTILGGQTTDQGTIAW